MTEDENLSELEQLKTDLKRYKELIVPFNDVLEWQHDYYPAVLTSVITVLFFLVWLLEPNFFTSISILGITVCTLDFAGPRLIPFLFKSSEWNPVKEQQFDTICTRLIHAKYHVVELKTKLVDLKKENIKLYYLLMFGFFSAILLLGSYVNTFLLMYFLVLGVILTPGLRKHAIINKLSSRVYDVISQWTIPGPQETQGPQESLLVKKTD